MGNQFEGKTPVRLDLKSMLHPLEGSVRFGITYMIGADERLPSAMMGRRRESMERGREGSLA